MDIDLSTAVPASPGRTLRLAETLADLARALNHDTLRPESLQGPEEVEQVLRYLATTADRFPQLLEQLSARLSAMRIMVTAGQYAGQEARAAATVAERLVSADAYAGNLRFNLNMAAEIVATMKARETGSDE